LDNQKPTGMNPKTPFKNCLQEITAVALRGDAREERFYPILSRLLEDPAQAAGKELKG